MKDRLRAVLLQHLTAGHTIGYRELAAELGLTPPHTIHRVTLLLEELVRDDHAAGRPLLATVAVGKHGLPGRGFFALLAELGRGDGADTALYARELTAALAFYSAGLRSRSGP